MSPRTWAAIGGLLMAARASALQPLDDFLRGARGAAPDVLEARATQRQAAADRTAALGRALPRLSLRGTYTRNEFESRLTLPGPSGAPETFVITPREQLDGTATLDIPLVDLASFARIRAARTLARAAGSQAAATDLRVQAAVAQAYYQLTANAALVEASRRALDVARASLTSADRRHQAGAGPLLDVDRARAEVERNVQQLASAELAVSLAARALQSL
jgi:outer membrane protein TolC